MKTFKALSCRHRHIVLTGNDETGVSAARCADCRTPLARRIEGGDYVYFVQEEIK